MLFLSDLSDSSMQAQIKDMTRRESAQDLETASSCIDGSWYNIFIPQEVMTDHEWRKELRPRAAEQNTSREERGTKKETQKCSLLLKVSSKSIPNA